MKKTENSLGLYVHIPFCVKKCRYCDFLSFPCDKEVQETYIEALLREIDQIQEKYPDYPVNTAKTHTIYIGGGTPSILKPALLEKVLCKLREQFQIDAAAEITMEANPGTLSKDKLKAYHAMGINRLSIGLQSADNEELKLLGRIHTYEDFYSNYELAREAGFQNINVDLMTALPGQTKQILAGSMEKVLALKPEHISAYSLILEEHTPFYDLYQDCISEETERMLYYFMRDTLTEHGYRQYEISNFSRPGMESRHNTSYWKRTDYMGLGLGAASLLSEVRYQNETELTAYFKSQNGFQEITALDEKAQMEEFMFLGLRLLEGVSRQAFSDKFHTSLEDVYDSVLEKLQREGLLTKTRDRFMLTTDGIDYGNYVFASFLL